VGKDEFGVMYGRNQTIPNTTKSYQKTPLDFVQKIDAKAVKADVLKQTGIGEDSITCFNLYGELMCNKGLYNYSTDKLDGTHQLFGAMLKPANKDAAKEIVEKLGAAKYACKIKGGDDDEEEDAGEEGKEEDENCNIKICLYMNQAFKDLIMNHGYPIVPLVGGQYASFYDLVMDNFDWMKNGNGEGLVLVSPADGPNCRVSKWKIGHEASGDNLGSINRILMAIDDDAENKLFGENTEKAKELLGKMLEVE